MPPTRKWRMRIADIVEAITRAQRHVEGMSFEDFASDDKTVDAVVKNITVIGEAARQIPPDIAERHPEIPWDDMRGMRNVIVHEYFRVSLPIVWQTVRQNLPAVVAALKEVLEETGS